MAGRPRRLPDHAARRRRAPARRRQSAGGLSHAGRLRGQGQMRRLPQKPDHRGGSQRGDQCLGEERRTGRHPQAALAQRQRAFQADVVGRTAHHQLELARFRAPRQLAVEEGQRVAVDGEADAPRFARLQAHLLEALQLLQRTHHRRHHVAQVKLHNLRALHLAAVGQVEGQRHLVLAAHGRAAQREAGVGEVGVAQAMAKRIARRVDGVDVGRFVDHVLFIGDRPPGAVLRVRQRNLAHAAREGDGQLAGRVVVAKQH
ncbi:conserved hypothetical protein, partial [Ricinus communis]